MPLTVSYNITQFSSDLKIATLVDNSTYEDVNRYDYNVYPHVTKYNYDTSLGTSCQITSEWDDPSYDSVWSVYLEQTPFNGDGVYKLEVDYETIATSNVDTYLFWLILTPKTEREYANMLSEASEECCSVDFTIEKIKDLLFVGCFLDATYIIKDREKQYGTSDYFTVAEADRLVRRIQTIIE